MWPDKESEIDYLNFGYLVDMVADIATNRELSPSTIGLYGDWGSGKSSLMKLVRQKIEKRNKVARGGDKETGQLKSLCIEFNGWLFEGYEDAKTSLCGVILDSLADERRFGPKVADKAKELLQKIDFKKILGKGVKYGLDYLLTGGIGSLAGLTLSSVLASLKDSAAKVDPKQIEELLTKIKADEKTRTEIKNFRKEFGELLADSEVENLVVFIDELDRCLPDTILEIFEAMRLFLFVDGTSFVIGADQRLIQYAIKSKYKEVPGNNLDIGKEYLEKVVQYPITIPELNKPEVNQYLSCLLLEKTLSAEEFKQLLTVIYSLQPEEELTIELIKEKQSSIADKCRDDMALARQISSVLAPSINGNPRQCKRFLNMLYMRMIMARSRHVELDKNILAKLMLAEYFNPDFFKALTKPENRELFKAYEQGVDLTEDNPFAGWKDKDWVKGWMKNGTDLGDEKLDKYVYFANAKNRYGQSNLDLLSPTARKCYEYLVDGTETNRNKAILMVKDLTPGEKAIISSEVFSVIENSSAMNELVLRSYADFCAAANMIEEALKKMLEQPASKYSAESYAQLASFRNKLSDVEAKQLKDHLYQNESIKSTIDRDEKMNNTFKKIVNRK